MPTTRRRLPLQEKPKHPRLKKLSEKIIQAPVLYKFEDFLIANTPLKRRFLKRRERRDSGQFSDITNDSIYELDDEVIDPCPYPALQNYAAVPYAGGIKLGESEVARNRDWRREDIARRRRNRAKKIREWEEEKQMEREMAEANS